MATPKTKVFVGHLPDGCKTGDLQALFEKYGTVKECDVINKYGFVHMNTTEEAEEAIKNLNNFEFNGSTLSVEFSKSKLHLAPGTSGRAKPRTDRDGYGPSRISTRTTNGYRSSPYRSSKRDAYYDRPFGLGSDRLRPYPSPYDRRSPPSMMHDDYMRRLPPPGTTDPYMRTSEFYSRSTDPYAARVSDSYARVSDSYSRLSDPYTRARDPYAATSDPYARSATEPYARSADPYARPIPTIGTRDDLYERRSMLERSDYLYSRRSPPPISSLSRSYWYGDSLDSSTRPLSTSASARRIPSYY